MHEGPQQWHREAPGAGPAGPMWGVEHNPRRKSRHMTNYVNTLTFNIVRHLG